MLTIRNRIFTIKKMQRQTDRITFVSSYLNPKREIIKTFVIIPIIMHLHANVQQIKKQNQLIIHIHNNSQCKYV